MKKILALVLALAMVLSLTSVFAEEHADVTLWPTCFISRNSRNSML